MDQSNWQKDESLVVEVTPEASQKTIFTITEAARKNNVTRQAIYVAIKQNKLKATKYGTRWLIKIEDLEDYKKSKYSREKSTFEGELLFDNSKGYFSINQAAKILNVPAQKIYYATRVGHLKASRKGAAWVIHKDEIQAYKDRYLSRPPFGMEIGC